MLHTDNSTRAPGSSYRSHKEIISTTGELRSTEEILIYFKKNTHVINKYVCGFSHVDFVVVVVSVSVVVIVVVARAVFELQMDI